MKHCMSVLWENADIRCAKWGGGGGIMNLLFVRLIKHAKYDNIQFMIKYQILLNTNIGIYLLLGR